MRSRSGQSTVEYLALMGCVAALLAIGAATLPVGSIVSATQAAFTPEKTPMASPAALAFVDQALAGSGPTLNDAIVRLGREVGPSEARALVLAHVLRVDAPVLATGRLRPLTDPAWSLARAELNGVGPSTTLGAWSSESVRAATTIRLVSAGDEQRWIDAQSPTLASNAVTLGTSGVVSLLSSINPATAVTAVVIGAGAAAADSTSHGTPAGSRAGDVIICRFVWRRNEVTSEWSEQHPFEVSRLRIGTPIAAVDIAIVRAGHLIEHDVIWSHAVAC